MKLLMLSTDRKIFEKGTNVRSRMISYADKYEHIYIIVFSRKSLKLSSEKVHEKVTVYPTNSFHPFLYILDAFFLICGILMRFQLNKKNAEITAQDPFEVGTVGVITKMVFGLPLELQLHTDFLNKYYEQFSVLNRFRAKVGRFNLRRADHIRVVSEKIKLSIIDTLHVDQGLIEVRPIAIDVSSIENASIQPERDLRIKYPNFAKRILMVSRLTPEKNYPFALEVFAKIAEEKNACLVIVGEGPEQARLRGLVNKLGINSRVFFEGWQNDVVSYYKTADVLLHTAFYEGYGMVFIEAQAADLPIISSDVGIASELAKKTPTMKVFPVNNIEDCVQLLRGL